MTSQGVARKLFKPIFQSYAPEPAEAYERIEDALVEQIAQNPVEVYPWQKHPEFLSRVRDAARYGGTEFLDLIIQEAEAITTRNQLDLPDPIDPSSI